MLGLVVHLEQMDPKERKDHKEAQDVMVILDQRDTRDLLDLLAHLVMQQRASFTEAKMTLIICSRLRRCW